MPLSFLLVRKMGMLILLMTSFCISIAQKPIWSNSSFRFFADSIVQGNYSGKAISNKEIISNYQSPANLYKSANISFKFSINGKDNEMPSGIDHHITCSSNCTTPLIKFGKQLNAVSADNTFLAPNTKFTLRVDMSDVFNAFDKQGYYTTFNGDKIYKQDFKGVYVAGSSAPLIWDFDNLVNHPQLQLKDEGHHIYSTTVVLNSQEDEKKTNSQWQLSKDISAYPQYQSSYLISDAIYNMSLEEMIKAIEPDSTFRTGKEWAGVWTRDISYSIILSMAYLQPRVAMKSLMRKVNLRKRIIQDTGTGGAWPCSTDRMIWAVAAYEVYKATGDEDWLEQAYTIIKNSIEDDVHVDYDKTTGMVKGESSFLDWREQTYPKWMQPADIYESECLGTNAVHYEANEVLAKMAIILHHKDVAAKHQTLAQQIKKGINNYLWMADKGYYAQYLYGRLHKMISPRAETLGEALCIIWNIADEAKQKQIVSNIPFTDFGTTCIYPEIPNIPPYHNNAVWPFVQTYFTWASVRAGNEKAVMQSIADIYRASALFATNKENLVAENGDFAGTQINSSNMLWSLSGNISLVHKVLFGIRFEEEGLSFHPFVPEALKGKRSLTNFRFRDAVLNIYMDGFGDKITSFSVDGKPSKNYFLPYSLKGTHEIHIQLSNKLNDSKINSQRVYFSLPAPMVSYQNNQLRWQNVDGAKNYSIIKNGKQLTATTKNSFTVTEGLPAEYQILAIDKNHIPSFASEPLLIADKKYTSIYQAEDFTARSNLSYSGFTGNSFAEISTTQNRNLSFNINTGNDGWYSIDFRYANGNGPVNTENKCAIRTLSLDGKERGTVVFPQRGKNEWSNWGFSNPTQLYLQKGKHTINISFEDFNENMNGEINQAMIDYLQLIFLNK